MKLGLINSAWVQAGKGTAHGIERTKAIGFDAIDLFLDPLEAEEGEIEAVRAACDAQGLPIVSLACVALGLTDFNATVRAFHMMRVRAYLDAAKAFGARNVLLVLGEYLWQREVIPPAEQWRWAVANVRRLGEEAAERGVEIALEMEPFHLSLLRDVPAMDRFLREVDHPAVRANVDISHLVLAGQHPESLRALKGRIAHVHLSDCDGLVHGDLPPGRGVVDFPAYLKVLKELDVDDATLSIELEYSPEPDRIEEWVREAYEATARLMRDAGLRR